MSSERLVDPDEEARATISRRARRLIRPNAPREWKRLVGRANDWFDGTVYAFALGWHLEHKRRLNEARWTDLLIAVHGLPQSPDLFEAAAQSPFEKHNPAAAGERAARRAARREKWKNRK